MKKLWTLCTCCLSVGMMWAQTGNWTDEGNYDTSWWDGNNRSEYHITTAEQLAGLSNTILLCRNVVPCWDK